MTDQDETLREQIARERAALVADMEARRRAIEAEETLATARQAIEPATRGAPPPIDHGRQRRSAPPPADLSVGWQRYIADRIQQSEARTARASMKAIAEVLGADLVAAEKRIAALEAELRELRGRETDRRLRAVPSPTALIA